MTQQQVVYLVALLGLFGSLFVAGQPWGAMQARVMALEKESIYFHGQAPAGGWAHANP
jgi:hypothetical protein